MQWAKAHSAIEQPAQAKKHILKTNGKAKFHKSDDYAVDVGKYEVERILVSSTVLMRGSTTFADPVYIQNAMGVGVWPSVRWKYDV